jgi:hypothetical protein
MMVISRTASFKGPWEALVSERVDEICGGTGAAPVAVGAVRAAY